MVQKQSRNLLIGLAVLVLLAVAIHSYVPLVFVYGDTVFTVTQGESVALTAYSGEHITWFLDDVEVIESSNFGYGSIYNTPTDLSVGAHEIMAVDSTGYTLFSVNVLSNLSPTPSPVPSATPFYPTPTPYNPNVTPSPTPYNPNPTVAPTKTWVDGEITPLQYWLGNNMVTLSLAATALIGGVFFLMYMKRGGRLR